MKYDLTRRAFVGSLAVAGMAAASADDGWVDLFDGRSLNGWRPSENIASWKVVAGQLASDGPRSHLFYDGPVHGAVWQDFFVPGAWGPKAVERKPEALKG